MSRSGIFIPVLWSLMTCSLGFTMDRSVALVPPAWHTAPSLDTYQRVDSALNDKIQLPGRILQAENAKMSENRTHEKRSTTENVEMKLIEMKPIDEIKLTMMNDSLDSTEGNANAIITPRNVILLLIDERSQDEKREENSWKDYKEKLPFAVEGFLQSCRDIKSANFSMDNKSVSERKEKNCDCERVLRSNMRELLSWARQEKGMTTGEVSGSNFSMPFFLKRESSGSNENNAKLELLKSKRDSNNGLQVIDLNDRAVSPSITVEPIIGSVSQPEEMNYDVTWDIFDIFSKIRMALFRSLLESLHSNNRTNNEFLPHAPFAPKPNATNLIRNTIREMTSIPNDKGYMLIAVVPRSEGIAAVDLLQREVSLKNSLLIVMQICVGNQSSIPFVAQGPNHQILWEARVIDELPNTIKKAMITNDCHDTGCMNRQRRAVPIVPHVPIGKISSQELPTRKRVIRNENAKKPIIVKSEETTIGK